jgi:hypothetical protein
MRDPTQVSVAGLGISIRIASDRIREPVEGFTDAVSRMSIIHARCFLLGHCSTSYDDNDSSSQYAIVPNIFADSITVNGNASAAGLCGSL